MKKIAFRVDASLVIGTGHFSRCLVLADAFAKQKCQITFFMNLVDDLKILHKYLIKNLSIPLAQWTWQQDAQSIARQADGVYDLWVVDHYQLDSQWEQAIQKLYRKLLVIDDFTKRKHQSDYLLNQNLLGENSKKFLGPQYALLRPEFIEQARSTQVRGQGLKNILVNFGGTYMATAMHKTLQALAVLSETLAEPLDKVDIILGQGCADKSRIEQIASLIKTQKVQVHTFCYDMASKMLQADLCIGAAGISSWERCMLGLPCLLISVADNQVEVAKSLNQAGAARYLGDQQEVTTQDIQQALVSIHQEELKKMSQAALHILNNQNHLGADYIVKEIMRELV